MISFILGPYNPRDEESLDRSMKLFMEKLAPWLESYRIVWTDWDNLEHSIFIELNDEAWTAFVLKYPAWKYTFRKWKQNEVLE